MALNRSKVEVARAKGSFPFPLSLHTPQKNETMVRTDSDQVFVLSRQEESTLPPFNSTS